VGLANAGDVKAAQEEVASIARLEQANDFADLAAGGVPAKDVLRLAQSVANARIATASKDASRAVRHFEAAVALEDALAYSEPPFWYYPTRQSLGAAYLAAGELDKAEEALRASLARWALYGLMKLYERRGDKGDARVAKKLLENAWLGDPRALDLSRL
jgi:tetratricopeptide (TPR) repeat protein